MRVIEWACDEGYQVGYVIRVTEWACNEGY